MPDQFAQYLVRAAPQCDQQGFGPQIFPKKGNSLVAQAIELVAQRFKQKRVGGYGRIGDVMRHGYLVPGCGTGGRQAPAVDAPAKEGGCGNKVGRESGRERGWWGV